MVKDLRKAIFILAFFLTIVSKGSTTSVEMFDNDDLYVQEVQEALLPNVSNALNFGDSANINYLDLAACDLYSKFNFKRYNALDYDLFLMAYKGYLVMKSEGMISNDRYLTIMDFRLSANQRRLWLLDLEKSKIVIHELVSHGRNSGEEYAKSFSNRPESFKSSLGFYVTGVPYMGKNDYSLRLHGVEEGFNDNALDRGIVMHGADYVSHTFIRHHKRLGRSQGCPAVSTRLSQWLINTIQGGSCMFIYYPDKVYLSKSEIINAADPSKEFFQTKEIAVNLP